MAGRRNKGGGGGGHGDGGGEERWLLPYADMITLLLGLFIVLFAMSSIDAKQFDNVKRSLAQTFNGSVFDGSGDVLDGSNGVLDPTAPSQAETDSAVSIDEATRRRTDAEYRRETKRLQALAEQVGGNDVEVVRTEIGIQISIAGDALFDSGSYSLATPGIRAELAKVQRELKRFGHPIRIEGHTDGQPFQGEFGNDGLAAMRALSVKRFFVSLGYPRSRIETVSYGADRPKVPPRQPTDAMAANRRIEIVVLEPQFEGPSGAGADVTAGDGSSLPLPDSRRRAPSPADEVDARLGEEFDPAIANELAATGKAVG